MTKFARIAFTSNGKDVSLKDLIKCIKTNRDRNLIKQVFFHYQGLRKNNDPVAIALAKSADYDRIATLAKNLGEYSLSQIGEVQNFPNS